MHIDYRYLYVIVILYIYVVYIYTYTYAIHYTIHTIVFCIYIYIIRTYIHIYPLVAKKTLCPKTANTVPCWKRWDFQTCSFEVEKIGFGTPKQMPWRHIFSHFLFSPSFFYGVIPSKKVDFLIFHLKRGILFFFHKERIVFQPAFFKGKLLVFEGVPFVCKS